MLSNIPRPRLTQFLTRILTRSRVVTAILMLALINQALAGSVLVTAHQLDMAAQEAAAAGQSAAHHANGHDHDELDSRAHPETADHEAGHEQCCDFECQACTLTSCSSAVQPDSRPGILNVSTDDRLAGYRPLKPAPHLAGLYRPPISR